ncbi:hypothetical protein F511_32548 [Dorcoceras hygrometricum]|uniref:Uncharacterized protein n=1 Tax=Dorcoceras hygrometricum TaxID=472368 RepID=A0A2Z7C7U5_9LAMI|nr:hypothetical protein F511_32548 [Dorcoceras hygrometricum]
MLTIGFSDLKDLIFLLVFKFEVERIRCGLLVTIRWLGTDSSGSRGLGKIVFEYELLWVPRWIDEYVGKGCLEDIRFEVYRLEKVSH